MNKQSYVLIFVVLFFNSLLSQELFEKGYFISNNNSRTECFIKNIDWKNNPVTFKYKMTEVSEVKEGSIASVMEFSVTNKIKFIRANVDMDMSPSNMSNLGMTSEPEWEKSKIFLRVLMEGNGNLFYYESGNLRRYFYSIEKGELLQLVHKKYLSNDNRSTLYNNGFRQQLFSSFFGCRSLGIENFENLSYKREPLVKVFEKYNNCVSGESSTYVDENLEAKNKFIVKVKTGFYSSDYKFIRTTTSIPDVVFNPKYGIRLGIEGELILPFNNDKWGVFFAVEKNLSQSNNTTINSSVSTASSQEVKLIYNSIEYMMGFNHYIKLNDSSKLYLRLGYLLDYHSQISLDYESSSDLNTNAKTGNIFGGFGYEYKKFGIEFKTNFGKKLFGEYAFVKDELNEFNVMLTYSLL